MKWIRWYLYIRKKVKQAYLYEGGAIAAGATLEVYGYARSAVESIYMAKWLAHKHGWTKEESNE